MKKYFVLFILMLYGLSSYGSRQKELDSLLKILNHVPADTQKVNILFLIGNRVMDNDPSRGLIYGTEALELSQKMNWQKGITVSYKYIGAAHYCMSDYPNALKYYQTSLKYALNTKDKINEAIGHNDVAEVYVALNDYPSAIESYEKALKCEVESGDKKQNGVTFFYMGIMYSKMNQLDKALDYLQKALKLSTEAHHYFYMANEKCIIAEVYSKLGNYPKAMEYASTALEEQGNFRNNLITSEVLLTIGNIYIDQKDYTNALLYGKRSLDSARSAGALDKMRDAWKFISDVNTLQKRPEDAFYAYRNFIGLRDSIINVDKQKKITSMQMQATFDQKIAAARAKQEKKDAIALEETRRQRLVTILSVSFAIVVSTILIFLFISIRKTRKLNKQLEEQQEQLRETDAIKNKLFSAISHDLRSPLSTLSNMLVLIEDDDVDPLKKKNYTNRIKIMLLQTTNLLDNLLQWAAGQISGIKPSAVPVNIFEIILESINLYAAQADKKNIAINTDSNKENIALVDINMLRLALRNILSNAIKFSHPNSEVKISTKKKDNSICIIIEDSGIGMDKETVEKLLRGQMQQSKQGTNKEKGFGIGLHLTKDILSKNGGDFEIESEPGKGSTFYITVPEYLK